MRKICLDIGELIEENRDRCVCDAPVYEWGEDPECDAYINLPEWFKKRYSDLVDTAIIYLAARILNDHLSWKAFHIKTIIDRKYIPQNTLTRLVRESETSPEIGDIDWVSYWRGLAEAYSTYISKAPVIVMVRREKRSKPLKARLEGPMNPRHRKKSWGIIGEVGGRKLGPWIYAVPREKLHILLSEVGDAIEIVYSMGDL